MLISKRFKTILFAVICLPVIAFSQDFQILSSFTKNGFELTSITETELNSKWGYFNLNQASADYDTTDKLGFESSHYLSYNISRGLGVTGGLTLQNDDVLPQLGLGLDHSTGNFSFNIYGTGFYSLTDDELGSSFNSLIEYVHPISDRWDFYNLLIIEADITHDITSQNQWNIGFQRNKNLQFGMSFDFDFVDDFDNNDTEVGIFLGVNL
ncbi:MAG: hypothetical protein R2774_00670 [Saprospiraceae bacterium]